MENPNNWAAIADCPDEIQLTVVTRLGCIPVQGVRVQCMVREKTSTNPLGISTFDIHGDKINIVLTYANENARMKTETVRIDSECGSNSAYFAHFIPKIRDIMDHGNEDGNIDKDDLPADFEDKYIVNAEEKLQKMEPIIYESSLEIEKKDNRDIYKFRVCLATFSLDVPYINQNYGLVEKIIENDIAKCKAHNNWNYENYLANYGWDGDHVKDITKNNWDNEYPRDISKDHWIGDVLCAPTSATMILMYYGYFIVKSEENTGNKVYNHRAKLMERFFNIKYTARDLWEDMATMTAVVNDVLASIPGNKYEMRELFSVSTKNIESNKFNEQMESANFELLNALRKGHPLYASIVGKHLIVVRGFVVSKNRKEIWAICNDPYGNLAGKKSNYSIHEVYEAWYSGNNFVANDSENEAKIRNTNNSNPDPPRQSNPKYRRTRNISFEFDGENAIIGQHVYYNATTHSRTQEKTNKTDFKFFNVRAIQYKWKTENDKSNIPFVVKKLIQGL